MVENDASVSLRCTVNMGASFRVVLLRPRRACARFGPRRGLISRLAVLDVAGLQFGRLGTNHGA